MEHQSVLAHRRRQLGRSRHQHVPFKPKTELLILPYTTKDVILVTDHVILVISQINEQDNLSMTRAD